MLPGKGDYEWIHMNDAGTSGNPGLSFLRTAIQGRGYDTVTAMSGQELEDAVQDVLLPLCRCAAVPL